MIERDLYFYFPFVPAEHVTGRPLLLHYNFNFTCKNRAIHILERHIFD